MKRLTTILKWFIDNKVNINSVYFDEDTSNVLIMYNNSQEMIELNENDFIYYQKKVVKRFSSIRSEEILKFLDGNL